MRAHISPRAGAIHYRVDGPAEGPAILFGNSLGTDLRLWDAVVARLPAAWRILRMDKRGHGLSEPPTAPFTIEDLADDALEVLGALGIDRFAYVGVSIGGLVGQALAARAGARLTAVALCDTGARIGDQAMWLERAAQARADGVAAMAPAIVERWFTPAFHAAPERVAPWRALVAATSDAGYAGCCDAIRMADFTAAAPQISAPTLCLWGDSDISTPPATNAALADLIPNAERLEIAESGHLPCADQPDATAAAIGRFLADKLA